MSYFKQLKTFISSYNRGVKLDQLLQVYERKVYHKDIKVSVMHVSIVDAKHKSLVESRKAINSSIGIKAKEAKEFASEDVLNILVELGLKSITNVES